MIQEMTSKINLIRGRIRIAEDKPRSYVDADGRHTELEVGDQVFVCVSLMKEVMRFDKNGKLSSRYM